MTHNTNEQFHSVADHTGNLCIEDVKYEACKFTFCGFSYVEDPSIRSVARRVQMHRCEAVQCRLGPGILEDIHVENLKVGGILIAWATAFKHVVLKGKINAFRVNRSVGPELPKSVQLAFDKANYEYYRNTDWALDISEAELDDCWFESIPADLIRRNPETQVVVRRANALACDWRGRISPWNDFWAFWVDTFLKFGEPDVVLIAPKGKNKKERKQYLDGLQELRDIGLADSD